MESSTPLPYNRFLIVNGDDFGLSDGVTKGIVRAWQEGIVTSASAIVNFPGAIERIAQAHQEHPQLPIGLHLNITEGTPVTPGGQIPTLVDAKGQFYNNKQLLARLEAIDLEELRAELFAQARLLSTVVTFDHIDYHHHTLALYKPFFEIALDLASFYQVPVRQPVPESVLHLIKSGSRGSAPLNLWNMIKFSITSPRLAAKMFDLLSPNSFKPQVKLLRESGLGAPEWFIGAFYSQAKTEYLINVFKQLPDGVSELMVHPGTDYGYMEDRAGELAALTDPAAREALDRLGIQLVDFSFVNTWNLQQAK